MNITEIVETIYCKNHNWSIGQEKVVIISMIILIIYVNMLWPKMGIICVYMIKPTST